ncbi:hypothetical protein QLX08_004380 [Tetragonisca angustula]|uniref:NADH dehydrogenase subunit 4 n=1 Tax=Tetragonisca angustula TaxID=166442 RepID=A0AAW1A2F4_9HYME
MMYIFLLHQLPLIHSMIHFYKKGLMLLYIVSMKS